MSQPAFLPHAHPHLQKQRHRLRDRQAGARTGSLTCTLQAGTEVRGVPEIRGVPRVPVVIGLCGRRSRRLEVNSICARGDTGRQTCQDRVDVSGTYVPLKLSFHLGEGGGEAGFKFLESLRIRGFCSGRALRKIHNTLYVCICGESGDRSSHAARVRPPLLQLACCMHACIRPFGPAPDPALPGRRPGLASAAAARGRRPDACSRGAGASVARAGAYRDRYRCSIEAAAHVNCIIMIIFLYPWCLRLF